MRIIQMNPDCLNSIGKAGENLAAQARFPVADTFRALYGEGTFVLCLLRAGDTEPYAVQTGVDGANVVWNITAADTQFPGFAAAELRYYSGDILAKSVRYRLFVEPSVGEPSAQPPEPMQDWIGEWMESKEKIDGFLLAMEGGTDGQVWTKAGNHAQWSDQQSGGSGEKHWQLIKSATVPADPASDTSGVTWVTNANGINKFLIDSDNAGDPFSYKKVRLIVKIPNKDAQNCCIGNWRASFGINTPTATENKGWVFKRFQSEKPWASVIVDMNFDIFSDAAFVKTDFCGNANYLYGIYPQSHENYGSFHYENLSEVDSECVLDKQIHKVCVVVDGSAVFKAGTVIELYAEV